MLEMMEGIFHHLVEYGILALEAVGVVILLVYGVRALVSVFTDVNRSKRLMSEGITTALSFLLGGEVMHTIIAPGWQEIGMTCAILLMRAAVTVLLHWEQKNAHHEG